MLKYLAYAVLAIFICLPVQILAQKPVTFQAVAKAEGIELPTEVIANVGGFTMVQAKCAGTVKWLVISDRNINYLEDSSKKAIVLASVPENAKITVFAVGLIDGKITDFISTKVVYGKNKINKQESEPDKLDYKIRWH